MADRPDSNVCKFSDEPWGCLPEKSDISSIPVCQSGGNGKAFDKSAIIIDNGSYECRAGYASKSRPMLTFKNLAYRQKGRNNEPEVTLVGLDIENLETLRTQLKSPFDKNVVTQFDAQEMVFDYIFSKLGVKSEEKVEHAIFMTEPIANPNMCRKYMAELLFECYSVPNIGFFTDTMASWYENRSGTSSFHNGVMITLGYQTSHVVPIIEGLMDLPNVKRISLGGYHIDYFMQRLLQLKYPIHSPAISLSRAEEIVQNHTWIPEDYFESCTQWLDPLYYEKMVKKMQLPYGNVPANFAAVALQGELQVERAKLTKERQALEKLEDKKHILDQLCEIRELTGTKLYRRLAELGVDSLGELQCHIKAVKAAVEDMKRKLSYKEEYNNGTLTKEWLQKKIDDLDNPDRTNNLTSFDVAEYYQLHVGIEQIRAPEVLFQPSMIGIDQGGVSETLSYVLSKYPTETQDILSKNIVLTGGCANIPGLQSRVEANLRSIRPFKSELCIEIAQEPSYSSWKGAQKWLMGADRSEIAITKANYDEMGGEYLIEHELSNRYFTTPSTT